MKSGGNDGFTLVEMLVAMAIAAVAVALYAGNPFAVKRTQSVAQIAREVAVAINSLEAKAVSTATSLAVWVDVKSREIIIAGKTIKLPHSFELSIRTGAELISQEARGAIWLLPNGTSSGGEITLRDQSGQSQTIRINWVTGAIKLVGAEN